jgi:hypothetical protein
MKFTALYPLLLIALSSRTAGAISVAVTPDCGTTDTHFIVSVGGLPGTPLPCPDSCHVPVQVAIDGNSIFLIDCQSAFSIDLQDVPDRPPGQECVVCNLGFGEHVVTVTSTNLECTGDTQFRPFLCINDAFAILLPGEVADPWADDLTSTSTGMRVAFFPGSACDVPDCDSLQLIQSIRVRGVKANGDSVSLSYADLKWRPAAERAARDSQLTVARYRIDVRKIDRIPYVSIPPFYNARPGRQSAAPDTATFTDAPIINDFNYPSGVVRIVLEFEVNAFCAKGEGQGHWIGKTFWLFERDSASSTIVLRRDPQRSKDRDFYTAPFKNALDTWSATRGFSIPQFPHPPPQGGAPCN